MLVFLKILKKAIQIFLPDDAHNDIKDKTL